MSARETLFDLGIASAKKADLSSGLPARDRLVQRPVRNQVLLPRVTMTLDGLIGVEHPVRAIWDLIDRFDLRPLEAEVRSNRRQGGRPAIDVRILLTLWVYGTTQGEGRASEIARLCSTNYVYLWICGGVHVSERALGEFRASKEAHLDALLTQILAVIIDEDLAEVSRTAQDGTRVRASAGTGSFRRLGSLERALEAARSHLAEVKAAARDPKRPETARVAAERGAEGRVQRIQAAIERVREMGAAKNLSDEQLRTKTQDVPRASMTDPDATIMKMGDGGFRPAYNVQFATTTDGTGVIVGVDVTMRGTDQGEMAPMLEQIAERTGRAPDEHLVDAGYASHDANESAARAGTTVYAPLPKTLAQPGSRRDKEYSDESRAWIARMQSEDGKDKYKLRGEVAELSNARAKSRYGLSMLTVRGILTVTCCALLVAVTANIERLISLRAGAALRATMTSMPA